ncbi:MAG: hypothetical protein ACOYB7_17690 [Mycobacterium sp.]
MTATVSACAIEGAAAPEQVEHAALPETAEAVGLGLVTAPVGSGGKGAVALAVPAPTAPEALGTGTARATGWRELPSAAADSDLEIG